MLVDMHLHALPNSTDSFLTLEEIVTLAKLRGLDAKIGRASCRERVFYSV